MKPSKLIISAIVAASLHLMSSMAVAQNPPSIDVSSADSIRSSMIAMTKTVPKGTVRDYAFRQALVFAIFDFKLSEAENSHRSGAPLPKESLLAHGMTVSDIYAHAVPYWQQELDVMQQSIMMGELKPDVTPSEAQNHVARLRQMISLGSQPGAETEPESPAFP